MESVLRAECASPTRETPLSASLAPSELPNMGS